MQKLPRDSLQTTTSDTELQLKGIPKQNEVHKSLHEWSPARSIVHLAVGLLRPRGQEMLWLTCFMIPRGMTGDFARRASLKTKKTIITQPKTNRHTTVGEPHGTVTSPRSRPISIMSVKATIVALPTQSIALRPAIIGVRGL